MRIINIDKGHFLPDIIYKKNMSCYIAVDYKEAYYEYKGEQCLVISGTEYKDLENMLDKYRRKKSYFNKKLKTCELLVIINDAV